MAEDLGKKLLAEVEEVGLDEVSPAWERSRRRLNRKPQADRWSVITSHTSGTRANLDC